MKSIGIITFHSSHNYGSVLQAYAMVCTMRSLGLQVSVIDYRHVRFFLVVEKSWFKGKFSKFMVSWFFKTSHKKRTKVQFIH